MDELDKAQKELEAIAAEQDGAAEDPIVKSRGVLISGFATTLQKAAEDFGTKLLGTFAKSGDDGHDPEEQKTEIAAKVKKAKKRNPANESDNQSYSEQASEQEETIEEAEEEMNGGVLVSGSGKKRADFRGKTPGRDVGSEVRAAQTDKSARTFDRDKFFKSLAESEEFTEVLEASPALAHLTDVVADRLEAIEDAMVGRLDRISKGLGTMMSVQANIYKSMAASDGGAKPASPGVIGRIDGHGPVTDTSNGQPLRRSFTGNGEGSGNEGQLQKSEIAGRLKKAVDAGEAHPDELSRFDVSGVNGLAMDDDTRKKYGIPISIRH